MNLDCSPIRFHRADLLRDTTFNASTGQTAAAAFAHRTNSGGIGPSAKTLELRIAWHRLSLVRHRLVRVGTK